MVFMCSAFQWLYFDFPNYKHAIRCYEFPRENKDCEYTFSQG